MEEDGTFVIKIRIRIVDMRLLKEYIYHSKNRSSGHVNMYLKQGAWSSRCEQNVLSGDERKQHTVSHCDSAYNEGKGADRFILSCLSRRTWVRSTETVDCSVYWGPAFA